MKYSRTSYTLESVCPFYQLKPHIIDLWCSSSFAAAQCPELGKKLGITHLISVCHECLSRSGENYTHLQISVEDTEYSDLLIYLPKTTRFIQAALEEGGRVLIHCIMGVSRSTTVVAAFRELLFFCFGFVFSPCPKSWGIEKWILGRHYATSNSVSIRFDQFLGLHSDVLLAARETPGPSKLWLYQTTWYIRQMSIWTFLN